MAGAVRQAGRGETRGGRIGRKTAIRRGFSALLTLFCALGGGGLALLAAVSSALAASGPPAVDFTDPADWKDSIAFPATAKQDAPAAEPSYAFDDAFLQTLNGREATVVSVTNNGAAGLNLWGVHKEGCQTGGELFDRDIFLDVCGGTFDKVSAGLAAYWAKTSTNAAVKGRQLTQLSGTARVNHVFGAGERGGSADTNRIPTLTGSAGIVVRDSAAVLGTLVGGWATYDSKTPRVTGDTEVLIKNVQGETSAAPLHEKLAAGLIIGGSAWGWNYKSGSLIEGGSSVTIDIPDTVTDATNFVKEIIGGSRSAPAGYASCGTFGGDQTVNGNSAVTISAPANVVFTKPIHAGGVDPAPGGYGTVRVKGTATLTLNGGTYADILDGGVADGEKKIVFNGPVCFGGETAIVGFDAAEAGPGAGLRVLPGARLSYGVALGAALPPFTLLGGTVAVDASFSPADILAGRTILAGTLAGGLGAQDVRGHFSGTVSCPDTGAQLPAAFTLEQGNRVMLSAGEPFVWDTTDGEWTETSFNNAPRAYMEDALLFFSDSMSGDGFVSVTNDGEKVARLLAFDNSAATGYALEGGRISVREFRKTGPGSVTVGAPLTMTGGRIFIGGGAGVKLADVGGTAESVTLADRDQDAPGGSWGGVEVNLGTNVFDLNGPVAVGKSRTLTLATSRADIRTIARPVILGDSSVFRPKAVGQNVELAFSNDISGGGRVDKCGGGTVSFNGANAFSGPLTVYEGKMVVNGALRNCGAPGGEPVLVKPGATLRFEGNNEQDRMPKGGGILCDGGRVELYGNKIFPSASGGKERFDLMPALVMRNGATLVADCSPLPKNKEGHIKVRTVALDSSGILISGTAGAYKMEGLVVSNMTVSGRCRISYAAGAATNRLRTCSRDKAAGTVDIAEGGVLEFAAAARPFVKTGAGTLVAERGSSFENLVVNAGALKIPAESGVFSKISMAGGTTVDLSGDRSVLQVNGAMAIADGESVAVNLAGRRLPRDEPDGNGRRYIIRWGNAPAGMLVPAGRGGCRIDKLDDGAVLKQFGCVIIIR